MKKAACHLTGCTFSRYTREQTPEIFSGIFLHCYLRVLIGRKTHLFIASSSPDSRSSSTQAFPTYVSGIFCADSLSQWRDRTGFTPVSL